MARTTPAKVRGSRGRPAPRRRGVAPLLPALAALVVIAFGILLWQFRPAAGGARPISTLQTEDVHALLWSPTEPNTAFFGHHGGLLKSSDGGRSWQSTGLTGADAMSVAASSAADDRVYVAGHGVFRRSDDGGATWTAPDTSIQGADIHGFAQSPVDPNRLYAMVVGQGLLMSADGGATWTARSNTLPSHPALAVSADGRMLLAGTERGVQQSTDDGVTWTPSGTGLPDRSQVLALAVQPGADTVFAATSAGLYRRTGASGVWTAAGLPGPILAVAVSSAQPPVVLAVDDQKRVYRSEDGGTTWGG